MSIHQDGEVALMLKVREDKKEAFAELFRAYWPELFKFFCLAELPLRREFAEDCCQEVFCRLWRARHRYKPRGRLRSYIFCIAINLLKDERRKATKKPRTVWLDGRETEDGDSWEAIPDAKAADPAVALVSEENKSLLERAMHSLSEDERQVIVLRDYGGLSYSEIAWELRCPVGTVCSRRDRAIRKLAGVLQKLRGELEHKER